MRMSNHDEAELDRAEQEGDVAAPELEIAFGRRTFPDDVPAVWGARLIWPNDLVYNRQDLAARDDHAKAMLIDWLNGEPEGTGAIAKMKVALMKGIRGMRGNSEEEFLIYEDERGKIIGSPQGSYGYVYVAGWLKG